MSLNVQGGNYIKIVKEMLPSSMKEDGNKLLYLPVVWRIYSMQRKLALFILLLINWKKNLKIYWENSLANLLEQFNPPI